MIKAPSDNKIIDWFSSGEENTQGFRARLEGIIKQDSPLKKQAQEIIKQLNYCLSAPPK